MREIEWRNERNRFGKIARKSKQKKPIAKAVVVTLEMNSKVKCEIQV